MISKSGDSDSVQIVTEELYDRGAYTDATLMMSTSTASIYRVRYSGKTLCVKTPASDSGLQLDLLKREYKIGVGLSHPCIATMFRWESDTPVGPGIVMEYVDGCRLSDFLRENPSMEMRNRVFGQLLDVVEYLHSCGIVHNDIKPANIMVSRVSHSVKLIDFGLADNDINTVQRAMGGTPGYASPELVERVDGCDARSDIYSLGVVMRDIYGKRFGHVSRRCMSDQPERRYASVEELRKAWRKARRRPRVAVVTVLLGALVGAIAWNVATQRSADSAAAKVEGQARELRDSLSAMKQAQVAAADSIDKLNSRLSDIRAKEEAFEALRAEYRADVDNLIKELTEELHCAKTIDALYEVMGSMHLKVEKVNADFERRHLSDGKEIVARYSGAVPREVYNELYPIFEQIESSLK